MDSFIYVYKKRIDLTNGSRLIIQTGSCEKYMRDVKVVSYVNGEKTKVDVAENPHTPLIFVYKNASPEFDREYNFCIELPEKADQVKIIFVKDSYPAGREEIVISGAEIGRLRRYLSLNLVGVRRENGAVKITGWTETAVRTEFKVYDGGKELPCETEYFVREDIAARYPAGEITRQCGFELTVRESKGKRLRIAASCGTGRSWLTIKIRQDTEELEGKKRLAMSSRTSYLKRAVSYIQVYGTRKFAKKVYNKLTGQAGKNCHNYFAATAPDEACLAQQREYSFPVRPLFSIVIPVYRPREDFFKEMLESVAAQTYDNWQLCLADGGEEGHYMEETVRPFIDRFGTERVKYVKLPKNRNIADNTNEAIRLAQGDYIVFGDHDDALHPSALFECMRVLTKNPDTDFIYTDEDKIIGDTGRHTQAHFKPDFNPELLRHNNYICHMVAAKRELIDRTGELDGAYNGAQDYDYVLRLSEQAERICHIPKILYHWRISKNSTAQKSSRKDYANAAGRNAVMAHLKRMGVEAVVEDGFVPGFYEVKYRLKETPLVSIIIPNKDHIEDLKNCIHSIEIKSTYKNIEYIVVENNSTKEKTFAGYRLLEKELGDRLRIVRWEKGFNYSAINNFGAGFARGELYLLLNNDTELIAPDAIERMVSHCQNPQVGIVGAKLLYGDGTIQHAGVVLGYQGVAGHAFMGLFDDDYGYFGRAMTSHEVSAVTAACLLTKKSVYHQVGGLGENFEVAFNDVDYCMKVREAGYKIIYEAGAKLYHYESKTRGAEDTPGKQQRFYGEVMRFIDRWRAYLQAGDPNYNPNLDLIGTLYKIREI